MLTPYYLFNGTVFFYAISVLINLVAGERSKVFAWVTNLPAFIASLLGSILGTWVLLTGSTTTVHWGAVVQGLNYTFYLDRLAGLFILLLCGIGFSGLLYSIGYNKEYLGSRNIGFLKGMYSLFILSMFMVISAANAFIFLVAWEVMAVVSYFLVTFEHENKEVRKSGFIYLIMTHLASAFIIIAFLILYVEAGSLDYSAFHNISLTPLKQSVVFIFGLVGFGTKAGLVPFHIWLPRAHPAAPSNVSALMSGVMVKTAVYMVLRFLLDFVGVGPVWWGMLLMILGLISALFGILYAMVSSDLKRLLAYSTVENVGIIFIGIGAGSMAFSLGHSSLGQFAFAAALMHTVNHAVFKSLLFMTAGSVLQGTHTRNIERLGGLIKRMPYTAAFFLVGALASASFPPFNGFIGEWLTFQSLLSLGFAGTGWIRMVGPVFAALLGLVGALVAATFVKAFGITFLALPRTSEARNAKEVQKPMLWAASLLALMVLTLGVLPGPLWSAIKGAVAVSPPTGLQAGNPQSFVDPLIITSPGSLAAISPQVVPIVLAASIALGLTIMRLWGGKTKVVRDETWNCGTSLTPRMEYSGKGFVRPLTTVFKALIKQSETTEQFHSGSRYFLDYIEHKSQVRSNFEDFLYHPINKLVLHWSGRLKKIQTGSVHLYLVYILFTLAALLVMAK